MLDTAGEVETNSYVKYSYGPLQMDEQRQDDEVEPLYNSSEQIQDVALMTNRKQWTIEEGGRKGLGISMLVEQHDDDDCILEKDNNAYIKKYNLFLLSDYNPKFTYG